MEWEDIQPNVKPEAEFREIACDFAHPLEVLRESISNSFDHKATCVHLTFSVEEIAGEQQVVIEINDNGEGMTQERLKNNFWDLGNSSSRGDKTKIGEKGHGTKIYLRSKKVSVITHHATGAYESTCDRPFQALTSGQLHSPKIKSIEKKENTGTLIRLEGYSNNERSLYKQNIVKDYIFWFTKHGSFECEFEGKSKPDFTVYLKCLDVNEHELLEFGHKFATVKDNLDQLFKNHEANAGDYFVTKYRKVGRLEEAPEIQYEMVVYIEGDAAKRLYNPLLKERIRSPGNYRVADRYGIWLAKDYIPVQRVNDWIIGFGGGSNSFVLLHGFINCESFKLTANRGTIANTEPKTLNEVKKVVIEFVQEIDADMHKKGLYVLQEWQQEAKTLKIEEEEYKERINSISKRKQLKIGERTLLEPRNEAELFGLFTTIYALHPDKFSFEPLDYNASRGIDIIARNKSKAPIADCKYWYVELKYLLAGKFNHSFKNVRWIICWDFEKNLKNGSPLDSLVDGEKRELVIHVDDNGERTYFLDNPKESTKITIIRLKEFIEKQLSYKFS